jgi:hypothetical protein
MINCSDTQNTLKKGPIANAEEEGTRSVPHPTKIDFVGVQTGEEYNHLTWSSSGSTTAHAREHMQCIFPRAGAADSAPVMIEGLPNYLIQIHLFNITKYFIFLFAISRQSYSFVQFSRVRFLDIYNSAIDAYLFFKSWIRP